MKSPVIFIALVIPIAGSVLWWFMLRKKPSGPDIEQLNRLLNSRQQQSEILLSSVADGVVVIDTKGKVSLFNPAAAQLSGWQPKEAVGIDVAAVLKLAQEDGRLLTNDENPFGIVLRQKQAINKTLELTGRDNTKRIVSLVISPVLVQPNSSLVGAVAVVRDVSQQRKEEMQRAEFISTASHEMRTPVAAIEGYLALAMNDKVSTIDSKARGYLEKAHSSTQHLGKLFQDLLTSARAEDGRLSNHPAILEMAKFLEQLTGDLKFAAESKGLKVEFTVGSSGDTIDASDGNSKVIQPIYYVHADPDRLREVATNLFDNAVKYTEAGKISIGLTGNNEIVQFYIRDTGAGIPPEDLPHLFQKFYRVNSTLTRTIGGTGLGLFISRKIIELYNGRIWVESELDRGSTFYINLPRIPADKAAELQAKEPAQQFTPVLPEAKV